MAKQKHGTMASEIMVRCVDGMKIRKKSMRESIHWKTMGMHLTNIELLFDT